MGSNVAKDRRNDGGISDLAATARPQCGVDALAGRFAGPTTDIAGVAQRAEGCGTGRGDRSSR